MEKNSLPFKIYEKDLNILFCFKITTQNVSIFLRAINFC